MTLKTIKEEQKVSQLAVDHIKSLTKTKELFKIFADEEKFIHSDKAVTFFMAGSPGAGKTETSKRFIENIQKRSNLGIVRIDADEIRELCPGYNGQNSSIYQAAATLGVNKLYDYINKKKFNALVDGTFAKEKYAFENIDRALKHKRLVYILYIFQDPLTAWEFTLKREALENRKITLDVFIKSFLESKNNVQKVKDKYKNRIFVNIIVKNKHNKTEKVELGIENIDDHIKFNYTYDSLYAILKEIKI